MARIRTIKPEFWESEKLSRLTPCARLTFIGLISLADDEGRGRGAYDYLWGRLHSGYGPLTDPKTIAKLLRSGDVPVRTRSLSGHGAVRTRSLSGHGAVRTRSLSEWWRGQLRSLSACGLVKFYKVGKCTYYWIPGFCEHQTVDHSYSSKLPPPPSFANIRECLPLLQGTGNREQGTGSKEEKPGACAPSMASVFDSSKIGNRKSETQEQVGTPTKIQAHSFSELEPILNGIQKQQDCPTPKDETMRRFLKLSKDVTSMPNKLDTLRENFRSIGIRHGYDKLETWLMDPKNVGKDVIELCNDFRPPRAPPKKPFMSPF